MGKLTARRVRRDLHHWELLLLFRTFETLQGCYSSEVLTKKTSEFVLMH
jgi:hypothetical protein